MAAKESIAELLRLVDETEERFEKALEDASGAEDQLSDGLLDGGEEALRDAATALKELRAAHAKVIQCQDAQSMNPATRDAFTEALKHRVASQESRLDSVRARLRQRSVDCPISGLAGGRSSAEPPIRHGIWGRMGARFDSSNGFGAYCVRELSSQLARQR